MSAITSFLASTRLIGHDRKSPLRAGLIELITAPAFRIPNQTGRNSSQLGSSTLTDSPRCTPRAIRELAMRLARALTSP